MTWHEYFKKIAEFTANKSTCVRLQVGAVLVKENRIISIGYNGVARNEEHCDAYFRKKWLNEKVDKFKEFKEYLASKEFYDEHGIFSNNNEIHAETNCLGFAAKSGTSTNGCELYLTDSPCTNCAKIILSAGIKAVFFNRKYDRDQNGIMLLRQVGIVCNAIDFDNKAEVNIVLQTTEVEAHGIILPIKVETHDEQPLQE
jgi:dCMP deaminase